MEKLGIKEGDYTVCFQSRLDKKWLTPFSDKIVEEQGRKGAKRLLAFSPAFVADCLETVIEIGGEYQEIFEEFGTCLGDISDDFLKNIGVFSDMFGNAFGTFWAHLG